MGPGASSPKTSPASTSPGASRRRWTSARSRWPGTRVPIGPVIENGFYYDFFRNEPFTPEDFAAIEKKMREIIARDKPFTREIWTRDEAKNVFRDKGELFKVELVDAIPEDQTIKIYKQGD